MKSTVIQWLYLEVFVGFFCCFVWFCFFNLKRKRAIILSAMYLFKNFSFSFQKYLLVLITNVLNTRWQKWKSFAMYMIIKE